MQHTIRCLGSLSWEKVLLAFAFVAFFVFNGECLADTPQVLIPSFDPSAQVTALTQVTLVAMTEEKVVDDQTVLVQGKTIVQTGPSTQVHIPEDALVIDGKGAYLLPGLADMHMHTRSDWLTAYPVSPLNLYLANGVTTIRCFGPGGGQGNTSWTGARPYGMGSASDPSSPPAG